MGGSAAAFGGRSPPTTAGAGAGADLAAAAVPAFETAGGDADGFQPQGAVGGAVGGDISEEGAGGHGLQVEGEPDQGGAQTAVSHPVSEPTGPRPSNSARHQTRPKQGGHRTRVRAPTPPTPTMQSAHHGAGAVPVCGPPTDLPPVPPLLKSVRHGSGATTPVHNALVAAPNRGGEGGAASVNVDRLLPTRRQEGGGDGGGGRVRPDKGAAEVGESAEDASDDAAAAVEIITIDSDDDDNDDDDDDDDRLSTRRQEGGGDAGGGRVHPDKGAAEVGESAEEEVSDDLAAVEIITIDSDNDDDDGMGEISSVGGDEGSSSVDHAPLGGSVECDGKGANAPPRSGSGNNDDSPEEDDEDGEGGEDARMQKERSSGKADETKRGRRRPLESNTRPNNGASKGAAKKKKKNGNRNGEVVMTTTKRPSVVNNVRGSDPPTSCRSSLEKMGNGVATEGLQPTLALIDDALTHPRSAKLQDRACKAIRETVAHQPTCAPILMRAHGAHVAIEAIRNHKSREGILLEACGALKNLALASEKAVQVIASGGGVLQVIEIVAENTNNGRLLYAGMDALRELSDESTHREIVDKRGIEVVIAAMKAKPRDKLVQERGCRLLQQLAHQFRGNVKTIVGAGGICSVIAAMNAHEKSRELQLSACGALLNLAVFEECAAAISTQGGIKAVTVAMELHSDPDLHESALSALSYLLASGRSDPQIKVASGGGIWAVVRAMKNCPEREDVQVAACKVLGVLASSEINSAAAAELGTDQIIAALKGHPHSAGVQEAGCEALRYITSKDDDDDAARSTVAVIIAAMKSHASNDRVQIAACLALRCYEEFVPVLCPQLRDAQTKHTLKLAAEAFPSECGEFVNKLFHQLGSIDAESSVVVITPDDGKSPTAAGTGTESAVDNCGPNPSAPIVENVSPGARPVEKTIPIPRTWASEENEGEWSTSSSVSSSSGGSVGSSGADSSGALEVVGDTGGDAARPPAQPSARTTPLEAPRHFAWIRPAAPMMVSHGRSEMPYPATALSLPYEERVGGKRWVVKIKWIVRGDTATVGCSTCCPIMDVDDAGDGSGGLPRRRLRRRDIAAVSPPDNGERGGATVRATARQAQRRCSSKPTAGVKADRLVDQSAAPPQMSSRRTASVEHGSLARKRAVSFVSQVDEHFVAWKRRRLLDTAPRQAPSAFEAKDIEDPPEPQQDIVALRARLAEAEDRLAVASHVAREDVEAARAALVAAGEAIALGGSPSGHTDGENDGDGEHCRRHRAGGAARSPRKSGRARTRNVRLASFSADGANKGQEHDVAPGRGGCSSAAPKLKRGSVARRRNYRTAFRVSEGPDQSDRKGAGVVAQRLIKKGETFVDFNVSFEEGKPPTHLDGARGDFMLRESTQGYIDLRHSLIEFMNYPKGGKTANVEWNGVVWDESEKHIMKTSDRTRQALRLRVTKDIPKGKEVLVQYNGCI